MARSGEVVAPAARSTRTEPHPRRLLRWALLALPVLLLAERAWSRRWMSDDGFIHLRVVENLTSGHGPVFNAGERVEASTSPLWVFVLAVADTLTPFRLEWIAVVGGIALTLTGLGFAIAGARILAGEKRSRHVFFPAGAAVLVAIAPSWTFSSSGLEGGLASAWLGWSLWTLARWSRGSRRLALLPAILLGVGPLIRPELGIFTAALLGATLVSQWSSDRGADRARLIACVLLVPMAYEVFRMGYYASVVPNPAIAKEASRPWWGQGWRYLRNTVTPYVLWFPLIVLALGAYVPLLRQLASDARRRALAVAVAFPVAGLLSAIYIVRVGGDFMHARLLLPSLFAVTAPVAVVPFHRRYALASVVLPWAVVSLLFLRAGADDVGAFGTGQHNAVTVEDFGWGPGQPQRAWYTGDGVYYSTTKLPVRPAPGVRTPAFASYGIGIAGYALGPRLYVLDLLGLADPFTSHLRLHRRGLVAHEKPLPPPWIAARLTARGSRLTAADFPFPGAFGARPIDRPSSAPFANRVERARAVRRCARLERFADSYTARLTPARFVRNIEEAVANLRFRIPPEPVDASRALCRRK